MNYTFLNIFFNILFVISAIVLIICGYWIGRYQGFLKGYNEGYGHRFSQNDYNISMIFYSARYSTKHDLIPQRDTNDDPEFTISDAIQSPVSHLALSGNLID